MIAIKDIKQAVADYYGVSEHDLNGPWRTRRLAHVRHIAMALTRRLTAKSYPQIGQAFGDRDHATVIYGVEKIEAELAANADFAVEFERLCARLEAGKSGLGEGLDP